MPVKMFNYRISYSLSRILDEEVEGRIGPFPLTSEVLSAKVAKMNSSLCSRVDDGQEKNEIPSAAGSALRPQGYSERPRSRQSVPIHLVSKP